MVRIITDSAADYEKDELLEKDIICLPMTVSFGEKEYRQNVNITKKEFYERLADSEVFPKTSQPTPFEVEDTFRKIKDAGDECVVITISSGLSGTYQSVCLLKDTVELENAYIVDSKNATAGERILVDVAVKLRDEGKSAKEIYEKLEVLKYKVALLGCVDTLEYLYKGGRLSKTAYAVGTMANVKPIITVTKEGKVEVCHKALSMRRGIKYMVEELKKNPPDTDYPIYAVYSYDSKNGEILKNKIEEAGYNLDDENFFEIGSVIGAHVGRGAAGVIYIEK